jgi:hypothetical protein
MDASFHFSMTWGIAIALVLACGILVPCLYREIAKGKRQLTPRTPIGAGDARPGRLENPAPGQADAQADPYSPRAHANHASQPSRRLEDDAYLGDAATHDRRA